MNKVVDGLKIEYTESGSGDTVFLLHGWNAGKEPFAPIISVIEKKYRAIAFDFPGAGASDEPPEAWDVDRFADLCVKFIDSFGCKSVILLGHSFGGRVIIKLANRTALPFEISRIILVDSAGILPPKSDGFRLRTRLYKAAKKILLTPPVKAMLPNALDSLQRRMGSADYAAASPVMRASLVKVVNEDLTPLLPGISQDTLLVWGTADDATPLSDGETMERLIPNAGLAKIEGAGHYSWLDQPYVFNAIIKSYLGIE